jgi:hypothetical protein
MPISRLQDKATWIPERSGLVGDGFRLHFPWQIIYHSAFPQLLDKAILRVQILDLKSIMNSNMVLGILLVVEQLTAAPFGGFGTRPFCLAVDFKMPVGFGFGSEQFVTALLSGFRTGPCFPAVDYCSVTVGT